MNPQGQVPAPHAALQVPTPHAALDVALDDGSVIILRRHGNPAGPRLYFSHGNGFAADAYLPFWGELLAGFEIMLFDFRNHGWNQRSAPEHHCYGQMVRDLEAVFQQGQAAFGDKPAGGVFHSMSARTAMKHAIDVGWRWTALALFDPPNVPPRGHPLFPAMEGFEKRLVAWARSRTELYADPAELAAEYHRSRTSRAWVAGAQELMAHSVLRAEPDAGWRLVCAPALEAAIYGEATSLQLWPLGSQFGGPVKLICADPDMRGGPATGPANRALGSENGIDYSFVPGTGHLLQIEQPAICRAELLAFLAANGIRPAA
jgi:pimeloyl-ACP methyl ester carboxylesterase